MKRLAVINVVGLTESLIGEHAPRITEFRQRGALAYITPRVSGGDMHDAIQLSHRQNAVGTRHRRQWLVQSRICRNAILEIQSNHIVHGKKIWDALHARSEIANRKSQIANASGGSTCIRAWITPSHRARCIPPMAGSFSTFIPGPYSIREDIKKDLGEFPFFSFWGPAAGIDSPQGNADAASRWIAESAKWIENKYSPTLNLIYLPHLDYNLQRHGTCDASGKSKSKNSPRLTRD